MMFQNKSFKNNLLVSVLAVATGFSTAVQAERYTFKAAVDKALANNPEMDVSAARIEQAQSALEKASASRLPQVTLSVIGSSSDNALNAFGMKVQQRQASFNDFGLSQFSGDGSVEPDALNKPDAQSDVNTRIELLLPIWNGGKIGSFEDQAKTMIAAAKDGDIAVQQFLTYNIYQAYEAVHAARAYIQVAEQAKETADSYVKTTQNLLRQGVVVRSEFLSAKVNQSMAEAALAKAQGEEKIALSALKMLMDLEDKAPIDVAERVDLQLPVNNDEELLTLAMEANPQLDAKRKQAEASNFEVEAAKADYYPSFNVMLRKDWNSESLGLENGSYTVAGVASWKITDFGVTDATVDMAKAAAAQKKADARSHENQVRLQVLTAWNKLKSAEQQVLSNLLAVQQADEARRLVLKRYNNGISTITELLAANTQLDKSRAELVAARYEVNIQKAKLLLATGRMDTARL